ncbi:Tripartite-type tricarboxylate transporter, receptor component TctC [Bosea sp. 62]|uniref:tripartite tricarboxylate transporter substrate binding protein n=1 Tax=unclassified Bosea (in: a-proteobacteria) TaxID=2653178 RepID=UPI001256889D|nr:MULTISPECIES: tripartite tricarboxylate transporter substrate binding protein [unclassified Bosea (in: a-proteobacteria)]CAD5264306.1 Tripartite-type tricarboxylate transporter, receptor component TctC [Bosea sp. 46]CAD5266765.1 Tripartite-type tricarboxylate transporter, receptor component TctC [Bosea sp. 21B]CAD5272569.1 Tripartite-type tricarboxylate transporter, receptor component TctC [Bosea sp. 7B]VVT56017.1 Tripartite-type tricarboxylate transporter, receptor component TctC [Bosea sp.
MKAFRTLALALGALAIGAAPAFAFPDRPVQLIVPWAAGGGMDAVMRIFANGLEAELKQPVNVINRTGGGGVTGHTAIATGAADGYTIGGVSPELSFFKTLGLGDLTVDSVDMFSRVSLIPAGVTVKADAPYKTVADFLKAVKENPKGTFTSSGTGTGGSWHVASGGLMKAAGLPADQIRWVPSNGGAPALQDLAAGGITAFTGSPIEAKAMLDGGRVRTILMMTEERHPNFPDVPSAKEAGLDWTYQNWFAIAAPKGVPADRRKILYEAAERTMKREDVRKGMADRGITPVWDTPAQLQDYVKTFSERGSGVLKDLGLAKN